jgi:ATP-dependent DNA helicase RecG
MLSMFKLPSIETTQVEFKNSFNDGVIETLVAFSNAQGGKIYIGVSDKGEITEIQIGKETIQNWINEIKVKTLPSIIPDIELQPVNNKTIAIISVIDYPIKPVSFK